jgi:hypothetical protein
MVDYQEVLKDLWARREQIDNALRAIEGIVGCETEVPLALPGHTTSPRRSIGRGGMTVGYAVTQAVAESLRTSVEVADCVELIRPGTPRNTIQSQIHYMIKKGLIKKDEDLKLHLVKGGEIQ